MNKEEFISLNNYNKSITIDDLNDKSDRTLLYGYDFDRETFHVYIKDREIVSVSYYLDEEPKLTYISFSKDNYLPVKRIYPEASDYEFCKLLKERGYELPFLPFNGEREEKQFYGRIL